MLECSAVNKGAFIIYERGGRMGENLKISIPPPK